MKRGKSSSKTAGYVFLMCMLIVGLFGLLSCGGGGGGGGGDSDSDGTTAPLNISEGVFLDSAVGGLEYQTPTLSGLTDGDGIFEYQEGENVTFSIGEIVLGQTTGAETITPLDLVAGAARDLISRIQKERKKLGTAMDQEVDVTVEDIPEGYDEEIKKKAHVRTLTAGDSFEVTTV